MEKGRRKAKLSEFLKTGIWQVRLRDYTGLRKLLIRYLRIFMIAGEQFVRDNCLLWASALTYYSLLSIVPVLAMGFAVAKGFGLQSYLEKVAMEQFAGQDQVASRIIDFSRNALQNASGGVIAGVGAIFLIWTVFQLLSNAEHAFNKIWEVPTDRTLGRKFTDYLSIMLVSPVLIVMSSSAMVLLATRIRDILALLGLGLFSPLIATVLGVTPYVLIWLLLIFIYVFLPNTKVNLLSGVVGGVLAGTIFVFVQWVYIKFQVGVSSYNAVYGSFAALPLFIIWMNLSWIIVLVGFEIVYAHQNQDTYSYEHAVEKVSDSFRRLLTLQTVHFLVKSFHEGSSPLRVAQISDALDIPRRLLTEILDALGHAGLVTEIPVEGTNMKSYQPARDIELYTLSYVIEALDNAGGTDIPVARTSSLERISRSLADFTALMERSSENARLKDI
jgi:membrane protein